MAKIQITYCTAIQFKFGSSPTFQAIVSLKEQRMVSLKGFPTNNHTNNFRYVMMKHACACIGGSEKVAEGRLDIFSMANVLVTCTKTLH
jgi:hypothetical protein